MTDQEKERLNAIASTLPDADKRLIFKALVTIDMLEKQVAELPVQAVPGGAWPKP
jgi:hypothetical protein